MAVSDLLSQDEIDALLHGVDDVEEEDSEGQEASAEDGADKGAVNGTG